MNVFEFFSRLRLERNALLYGKNADYILKIKDLFIYVPVYRRKSGNGQDIVDRPNSAVIFNMGGIETIADHSSQGNFSNLNKVVDGVTVAVLQKDEVVKRFVCEKHEVGHIKLDVSGNGKNRIFDEDWSPVYLRSADLCIYTCMYKSADDVMDIALSFWKEI